MAFGPIIDIPLLSAVFALIINYRNRLLAFITKLKLPKLVLALLASVPIIIFEEHINCGAYGCSNVFLPPTLLFVLIIELLFLLLLKIVPIKTVLWQTIFLSSLGVLFELFLGAAHVEFQKLITTEPLGFVLIVLWTGFSYAFVLFLPLVILKPSVK